MTQKTFTLLAAVALLAVGVVAYLWWPRPPADPPPAAATSAPSDVPAPQAAASVASGAAADPEIVASTTEPVPDAAVPLPTLDQSDPAVKDALVDLVGKSGVLGLLQTDGFLRRLVVTVDNLTRPHAASRLWPVNPTPGRFTVDAAGHVDAGNAVRYAAFVQLVDGVPPAQAAALYRRLYPLLQSAFEELGYPSRRFHGRLLAVIDHLLATPERTEPLAVLLTEVKGPIKSERPWVRYEFVDPQLQALSSGQKIMLRVGPAHRQRLKAWLRGFRTQIER